MNNKVLFVTQGMDGHRAACGIGLMGRVVGETLLDHPKYKFELLYADDYATIESKVQEFDPCAIIYNYAPGTTPWMDHAIEERRRLSHIKHFRMMHDMHQGIADSFRPENNYGWEYIIADDPTVRETNHVFITNRLLPAKPTKSYVETGVPIIGFQGFSSIHTNDHKGIRKVAHQVVQEFDEAIIKLHIPFGYYGDPHGHAARARVEEVKSIIASKPGIRVEASFDLLDTQEVIDFLAQNTVNCYFYDYLDGAGLASSPDYALAARRPIAVTRSHQMRNFWNLEPTVLIEQTNLRTIIQNGTKPLESLYEAYSKESVHNDYARILDKILT